jgi:hypothetical protein
MIGSYKTCHSSLPRIYNVHFHVNLTLAQVLNLDMNFSRVHVVVDAGTPLKPPAPPSFALDLFWNIVLLILTQLEMCSEVNSLML